MPSSSSVFTLPEPAPSARLGAWSGYPWLVVATTCIAAFIGQLDASIVQLVLPRLEVAFDAPLSAVSWVAIGYVLGFAAALPIFARLAEIAGRKTMYLIGFGLFGIASALCAVAPDLPLLVVFRLLQGAAGAMLGANSIVILVAATGPERRGRGMGWFAAAQAIGGSAGPALGGVLLATLDWRFVFWVTVPVSLATVVIGWLVVPQTTTYAADTRFDLPGALLAVPCFAAWMLLISESHAWGLTAPRTLACAAVALLLLAAFVHRERRAPAPLLDPALFRLIAFTLGSLATVLSYAMLYGMFIGMSFALVRGYADTPLGAGLQLTIIPAVIGLIAPFSGGWSDTKPRLVMFAGAVLCVLSALVLAAVLSQGPGGRPLMLAALGGFGAGLGLFIAANNNATLGAVPAEHAGQAGGLLNLMRVFGTGFGIAAAASLLGWRLERSTGLHERTIGADHAHLLAAVGDVALMLAGFALVAGLTVMLRGRPMRRLPLAAQPAQ
jgi:EmrB/QacA subfamily drug resistance transporter